MVSDHGNRTNEVSRRTRDAREQLVALRSREEVCVDGNDVIRRSIAYCNISQEVHRVR